MWWTTGSGRIELNITKRQAEAATHLGPYDRDVREVSTDPKVRRQLRKIDPTVLRIELRECGAWDEVELMDHEQNLQRLLWIACGEIADGNC